MTAIVCGLIVFIMAMLALGTCTTPWSIGTRSLLFGAHQFILHPLAVAYSWWCLFGFPWDPRLWVAFLVHDWGYWGKPDMDGHAGANHPRLGAEIMHFLFDHPRTKVTDKWAAGCVIRSNYDWYNFTIKHSRRFAKGGEVSRLCVADKLALVVTPQWLYLLLVWWSGEWEEYADEAKIPRMSGVWIVPPKARLNQWYRQAHMKICRWVWQWQQEHES
jgi:hypothetical protein